MKITTKTGDGGETGLYRGKRVSKGSDVIGFLGEVDELQAFLGWCRFVGGLEDGAEACEIIDRVQNDLYRIMAAVGGSDAAGRAAAISEGDISKLEEDISKYENFIGDDGKFIKPGQTEEGTRFHIARTVCRRAERSAVKYFGGVVGGGAGKEQATVILKYLNRLSDLLFVLGCRFEKL
ncbi:MAG: cob(I)yrinic acid a,c-diamide adenosyltransferase [Candidatus Peregrinibacteria bacterium]